MSSSITFDVGLWMREDSARRSMEEHLVSKPSMLAFYSKAKGSEPMINSKEAIRVYHPPSKFPLYLGLHEWDGQEENEGEGQAHGQASPVSWVIQGALASPSAVQHPGQVFTFRNNLNKLLGTTLNLRNEWAIDAIQDESNLLIDIVKLPQKSFPGSGLFNYLGRKFETVCTLPLSAASEDLGQGSECCLVVSLGLGPHRIIMGAEVDCLASAQAQIEPRSFLELKTVKKNAANVARNQWPKWWLQSFLVGIEKIVVGSRDDDAGSIVQIQELNVNELPSMASKAGSPFDANQCIRFGVDSLSWMKKVASDHPQKTIRFKFDPRTKLIEAKILNM